MKFLFGDLTSLKDLVLSKYQQNQRGGEAKTSIGQEPRRDVTATAVEEQKRTILELFGGMSAL